ncbi:neuropeptide B [Callithrix jacchus]
MARPATLAAAALALCLLLAPPGLAWYKSATGRNSYSVGRAAGLLSGFRRSPYARRSQLHSGAQPPGPAGASLELHPRLRSLALCVQDVAPNLQRCERLPDGLGTFQCKVDIFLSLRAVDCRAPEPGPQTWTSPGTNGDPAPTVPLRDSGPRRVRDGAPALPYSAHPAVNGK